MKKSALARYSSIAFAGSLFVVGAVQASVLYDSPASGFAIGYSLITNDGKFEYSGDSFVLGAPSKVSGVEFDSWLAPGDTVTSVDWAIYDASLAVTGAGTAAVQTHFFAQNLYGLDIDIDRFAIPNLSLAAGTYLLVLSGGVTAEGNLATWDSTTLGASSYNHVTGGPFPNSFRVFGPNSDRGGPPGAAVPEPATWAMMLAGFGGLGALMRRRRAQPRVCIA